MFRFICVCVYVCSFLAMGKPLDNPEKKRTMTQRCPTYYQLRFPPKTQEPLNAPFLNGLLSSGFSRGKRPLRTKSVKRPIKVGKRPINEGKRPIKAKVLVGVSVGCLMGCFRAHPPWRKTAPLKRPIKRSMKNAENGDPKIRNRDSGKFILGTPFWEAQKPVLCKPVL